VELGEQRNWLGTEELGGSSGTGWKLRNWAGQRDWAGTKELGLNRRSAWELRNLSKKN
jgi:hypothetical protein